MAHGRTRPAAPDAVRPADGGTAPRPRSPERGTGTARQLFIATAAGSASSATASGCRPEDPPYRTGRAGCGPGPSQGRARRASWRAKRVTRRAGAACLTNSCAGIPAGEVLGDHVEDFIFDQFAEQPVGIRIAAGAADHRDERVPMTGSSQTASTLPMIRSGTRPGSPGRAKIRRRSGAGHAASADPHKPGLRHRDLGPRAASAAEAWVVRRRLGGGGTRRLRRNGQPRDLHRKLLG
jgi:hypothetical protein